MRVVGKIKIGGVMRNDHLARISVMGVPGRTDTAAVLLSTLAQMRINVQFIVQCIDDEDDDHIVVCVDRDDLDRSLDLVRHVQTELSASSVSHDPQVASLGIFGPDFRERPGIAGMFFAALKSAGIHIQAISTSISTCTVIIAADRLQEAIGAIERTFQLPFA